ncbi:hypothetical protein [Sorangium cellulosum]|uniref:Uncharacterized protein n=1 Tax=Sorangium cellulosum TaxID=56 RepID=A0A150QZC5_SORCE|nr:hypothetical protein [Sorangium cellulosum]KYF73347.1 hypothetical protein BE15_01485 [Sorangium cellulosum]
MITKQLKRLLMIPSPSALRPRSNALPPEAAAGARAAIEVGGAARQEPSAPLDPGEAPRSLGEPAPGRAPAVPSYLRAAPVVSGTELAAREAPVSGASSMSLVPEGMRHFTLRGTVGASDAPSGPALPFTARDASASTAQPEALRPAPRPTEPASPVPPGMRGFRELRGTQPASDAASTAPVLPFGPPAPPAPATSAAETAVVPRGMRGFTSLTGTHPTSGAPAAAVLPFSSSAPAAPVAPSSPPSAPALSLEQYASLCAELAVAPGDAKALFGLYGLAQPDVRLAVDRFWRDQLARDQAAHRRWQALYWQHRARCSAVKKRPHEPR